jgi:hypothetical protein
MAQNIIELTIYDAKCPLCGSDDVRFKVDDWCICDNYLVEHCVDGKRIRRNDKFDYMFAENGEIQFNWQEDDATVPTRSMAVITEHSGPWPILTDRDILQDRATVTPLPL